MSGNIKSRLAKRLRELRQERGYSVSELAQRAGISRQHLRDLEMPIPQKRATIETIEKLAKAFKTNCSKLLDF